MCSPDARADGGKIRLSERCDNLQITVFTSPTPVQEGEVDVSVLVQGKNGGPIEQEIEIVAQHRDGLISPIRSPATRAAATNKLLQSATITLGQPGSWRIEVFVRPPGLPEQRFAFDLEAGSALPRWVTFWAWFTWPAVAIVLFCLHQCLSRAQRTRRPHLAE
jgi:hypothetical protein